MIANAIERYGMPVTVTHGKNTVQTKAFLQPLTRERDREPFSVGVLGAVDERCWRYLGPAEAALEIGDTVSGGGEVYRVRDCAIVRALSEDAYCWGLLRRREAAE